MSYFKVEHLKLDSNWVLILVSIYHFVSDRKEKAPQSYMSFVYDGIRHPNSKPIE